METILRILLLEDSLADARLIERELIREGFNFTLARARTEGELREELAAGVPDLVLSDNQMPRLGGFQALAIVRKMCPRVPFIFVSGSNDQQMVCDMYEEGANDYVFKRDLQDLPAAVANATGIQAATGAATLAGEARQAELLPQFFMPACGLLALCPICHQSRDETGQVVPIEDYCYDRIESLVVRKLCENCSRGSLGSPSVANSMPAKAVRFQHAVG